LHHEVQPELLRRTDAILARLGASHLAERPVAEMSSGEAKRILIARALVHAPQTMLFDEPSNTLDIAAQYQLRETMRQLAREGIGILLVTHHLADIIPEVERVILLQRGRILADGPKEKVLTTQMLTELLRVLLKNPERTTSRPVASPGVQEASRSGETIPSRTLKSKTFQLSRP
jgi:iron complex transport system ATP-binding protein